MNLISKDTIIKRNTALFILIALILLSFFLVRADKSFDCVTEEYSADAAVNLSNGVIIRQDIPKDITELSSVDVRFGTYNRINQGNVIVTLYEDEKTIKQWEYTASDIQDNSYCRFDLDDVFQLSDENEYYFTIEYNCDGNDSIAVWTSGTGEKYDNICYRLTYPNIHLKTNVVVSAVFIFVIVMTLILLPIDERVIMSLIVIILASAYLIICPLGMAPDEKQHFFRAYEIAHGGFISQNYGIRGGGNILPMALESYSDSDAYLDWHDMTFFYYSNMSLYAPVSYAPQAIGIRITEIFTNRVVSVLTGGRVVGALSCLALSLSSIWIIPYGRKIVFSIILFPLTLQEMISMAPDGFTISLSLFLFSFILYISCKDGKIRKREYTILTVVCLFLSLCKIVYVVLVLLVLLIPKEKYKQNKDRIIYIAGILLSSVILNLIWLSISSRYLIEFQPGVDTAAQVKNILSNPINYYSTVVRTLIDYLEFYIRTMVGSNMGALNITISSSVWVSYLIMFVSLIVGNKERIVGIRKQDKVILFFIFAACSMLIFTSLYVQWTALGNELILGVQGRYFIPIIALLAFGILYCIHEHDSSVSNEFYSEFRGSYYYVLLLLFNGLTALDIIHYYCV